MPTFSRSACRLRLVVAAAAAVDGDRPSSMVSRPLMQRSSVLLPEPLLPMMAMTSPRLDLEVDALEHLVVAEALAHFSD